MESTNTQNSSQGEERKLCGKCQMFYGTIATNFMCSKCFRETQEGVGKAVKKSEANSNSSSKADVVMVDAVKETQEEEKGPARPVQVSFNL